MGTTLGASSTHDGPKNESNWTKMQNGTSLGGILPSSYTISCTIPSEPFTSPFVTFARSITRAALRSKSILLRPAATSDEAFSARAPKCLAGILAIAYVLLHQLQPACNDYAPPCAILF